MNGIQTGAPSVDEQSAATKHHQGRAMRHRVSANTTPGLQDMARRKVNQACPLDWRKILTQRYRAALCQVFDSIFLDVPMSRVKFNVTSEYAYIQNFKVLQSQSCPNPRVCDGHVNLHSAAQPASSVLMSKPRPRLLVKAPD